MKYSQSLLIGVLASAVTLGVEAGEIDLAGYTEFELTGYADEGAYSEQDYKVNASLALAPEFYWAADSGNDSILFRPFYRFDAQDDERTHGDIRELSWVHYAGDWEVRSGIRKVFWGVTEFNHLVDIINQTDGVESFDGEEKLGQPMINFSKVTNFGIFDGFVLAGFRERTFAGEDGRLRSVLVVDTDSVTYESDDEENHIDYALRWSNSIDVFDVGVYWFDGTDRNPILQPQVQGAQLVLAPYYQQITQTGIDVQATIDSWLLKLETIYQTNNTDDYWASQTGFEYTLYGVNRSAIDVGLLLEYGWDQRGESASSISQNDVYLGSRITLNDVADSALLMGVSYDTDFHTRTFLVEASRRINDRWTVSLEGLIIEASNERDVVAALEQDDRLQLVLERYF